MRNDDISSRMQETQNISNGTRITTGYLLGIIAAISYGTNPLFAVPLYDAGLSVMSVLFYRYAFASLILGVIMLIRKESFRVNKVEILFLVMMGIMFALSSLLLFESYTYMDVGIASTMLFMEPVFIAVIMVILYHERLNAVMVTAIVVSAIGMICLCNPGEGAEVTAIGVIFVMLSSISYAVYMIAINKSRVGRLSGTRITFYSLLFGQIVFGTFTHGFLDVQPIPTDNVLAIICVIGLSVVPTIVSLLTVAVSVKLVGSVIVAILGALEPVTGVLVGTLVFGEVITIRVAIGIVLILSSVIVLILFRKKRPRQQIGN